MQLYSPDGSTLQPGAGEACCAWLYLFYLFSFSFLLYFVWFYLFAIF